MHLIIREQSLAPNKFKTIFFLTHYVVIYKIIYVYYLNKSHDLLKKNYVTKTTY